LILDSAVRTVLLSSLNPGFVPRTTTANSIALAAQKEDHQIPCPVAGLHHDDRQKHCECKV
jgi:hypothetical protein